jgi:hypothetical protein
MYTGKPAIPNEAKGTCTLRRDVRNKCGEVSGEMWACRGLPCGEGKQNEPIWLNQGTGTQASYVTGSRRGEATGWAGGGLAIFGMPREDRRVVFGVLSV